MMLRSSLSELQNYVMTKKQRIRISESPDPQDQNPLKFPQNSPKIPEKVECSSCSSYRKISFFFMKNRMILTFKPRMLTGHEQTRFERSENMKNNHFSPSAGAGFQSKIQF